MEAIQYAKESTAMDLGDLLDDCEDPMVTLVARGARLVAHRAVLMDRSPVFTTMFRQDTLQSNSGQVTIADVEGPVLRQLVSYLYTLRVPLPHMAPQLLAVADKYGVAGLKAVCEQQLVAQLSVETAAAAAVLSVRHSCDSLRKAAVNFIKANPQVMATQGWVEAAHNQSKEVVAVSRLLLDPRAETSAPAPAYRGTSASLRPATQPHSHRKRHCRTPASAAPATAASHQTPPPDDATVSRLSSLPAEEKCRKLILAAEKGAVGELEALLEAGADVTATDVNGWTALHCAADRGQLEAARRLVARGAPVDATGWAQQTPLHVAAHWGHAAVVHLLLAASAHHSASDCTGMTPLHWAAIYGKQEAAAALLDAGADRVARNNRGETPLDLAKSHNHPQLVELLMTTLHSGSNHLCCCLLRLPAVSWMPGTSPRHCLTSPRRRLTNPRHHLTSSCRCLTSSRRRLTSSRRCLTSPRSPRSRRTNSTCHQTTSGHQTTPPPAPGQLPLPPQEAPLPVPAGTSAVAGPSGTPNTTRPSPPPLPPPLVPEHRDASVLRSPLSKNLGIPVACSPDGAAPSPSTLPPAAFS